MNQQEKPVLQGSFSAATAGNRPKWSDSPVIPAFVVVLMLLPFVNKAIHIDDPLFIWTAQQIQKHPLDFYGFSVNWNIKEEPMFEVTKNPPLASYYIAAVASLFGFEEIPLHIFFILPAAAVAVGTFYLARRFCANTLIAALIAVLNPVFLVSSTTLMCDTIMLAFWVWALFFWMRGMETQKHRFFLLAAVLLILCALTKYFGLALIPLIAVYSFARKRSLGRWTFYLLLPIAAFALYQWYTFSLYGKGLLNDAFSFATRHNSWTFLPLLQNAVISLVFTGGCFLPFLFYSPLLWPKKWLLAGGIAIPVLIAVLYFFPLLNGITTRDTGWLQWDLIITMSIMAAIGTGLLGLALGELWNRRDNNMLLLFLWIIGTFVFAGFINWTINARSLLPMAPAVGILIACRLEHGRVSSRLNYLRWLAPLLPAVIISVSVAWSDYQQANTVRTAADIIHREFGSGRNNLWFEGHWGFQFYMQQKGHKPFSFNNDIDISAGDYIAVPTNNVSLTPPRGDTFTKKTLEFVPCSWLTVMRRDCNAGFYSHYWGPVPFLFGRITPDVYYVLEAKSSWKN